MIVAGVLAFKIVMWLGYALAPERREAVAADKQLGGIVIAALCAAVLVGKVVG
jgi:hypothetical protein